MKVEFELYNGCELVSPETLQYKKDFRITMQGREAGLSRSGESTFNLIEFRGEESDLSTHNDTLWMEIAHGREQMRIGFPPRMSRDGPRYKTQGLRIDFKPGIVMVTDLPKRIQLRGTIGNIEAIRNDAFCSRFYARMGNSWWRSIMVDLKTGRFDGSMDCSTIMDRGKEWVEVEFVAVGVSFDHEKRMIIRMPYLSAVDLGSVVWVPSSYRLTHLGLRIETALPRDTVIGELYGPHVIISPINPEPGDSMRFEFVWNNNGAPHEASMGGFHMKDCCTVLCDLTFAVRSDTDVLCDSWLQHVTLPLLPDRTGRYRLRQVPAQGEHLRDIDFLMGNDLYFTVGDRHEP